MVKYCKNCGQEVDEEALFCPNCKTYVDRNDSKGTSNAKWILIGIAVVLLIAAAAIFMSNSQAKADTSLSMISSSNLDSGEYSVLLTDKDSNPLSDMFITVETSNDTYTLKTNAEGVAAINLTLGEGSHEITSSFKGDSYYGESYTSDIIII